MKGLIVIPTYNERDNISLLIEKIKNVKKDIEILVVDDNSPDGTAKIVEELQSKFNDVYLIKRPKKMGIGTAYITGFKWGIKNGYDYIFELDADFSHDPTSIPNFIAKIKENDLVIGSRYVKKGRIEGWPFSRKLLSYFANLYAKTVTGVSVKDMTAGYKCYKTSVLSQIDLDSIKTDGYGFQIEIKTKAWRKGFKITEIPITFYERRAGVSKLSKRIIWQAFWLVLKLGVQRLFKKA